MPSYPSAVMTLYSDFLFSKDTRIECLVLGFIRSHHQSRHHCIGRKSECVVTTYTLEFGLESFRVGFDGDVSAPMLAATMLFLSVFMAFIGGGGPIDLAGVATNLFRSSCFKC